MYLFVKSSLLISRRRAHRIGQIRDVHIYRFISQHTVEEAMLRKANQKRSLDDLVIQKGEFDWRSLFGDESALTKALGEFEDSEDAHAAAVAAREEVVMEGADEADFGGEADADGGETNSTAIQAENPGIGIADIAASAVSGADVDAIADAEKPEEETNDQDEDGGTTVDYMLSFIHFDMEFFLEWRL
jgi:helicase SWR1